MRQHKNEFPPPLRSSSGDDLTNRTVAPKKSSERKEEASAGWKRKKEFIPVTTKAPTRTNSEIPILCALAKASDGRKTKDVLREVKRNWFKELHRDDLDAVYPESKKRVVDTIIKFSRKHLVEKGEIHPPTQEDPVGRWRATKKGIERALKEREGWKATYVEVSAVIEVEKLAEARMYRD
jgi:hypothetical protein